MWHHQENIAEHYTTYKYINTSTDHLNWFLFKDVKLLNLNENVNDPSSCLVLAALKHVWSGHTFLIKFILFYHVSDLGFYFPKLDIADYILSDYDKIKTLLTK